MNNHYAVEYVRPEEKLAVVVTAAPEKPKKHRSDFADFFIRVVLPVSLLNGLTAAMIQYLAGGA